MNKTKAVVSETKKRLIDDIHYLLKEIDSDIVSKSDGIDNSAIISSIVEDGVNHSIVDLVMIKEYLKDSLKAINASAIIAEEKLPNENDPSLDNISDTPEDMESEVEDVEDSSLLNDFENVKTKAQNLISRIENSEDEVPDIADTSKLVSISVAIQEKIDELNNVDISDNSFPQKFEELKQFITSKESEVIDILGGDNANELNDIISDEDEGVTASKAIVEPNDEDAVTKEKPKVCKDEVLSEEKPSPDDDVILGIGMDESEMDEDMDLSDEDLENPDFIADNEPTEEEILDEVSEDEAVTSEVEMLNNDVEAVTSDEVVDEEVPSIDETCDECPKEAGSLDELLDSIDSELGSFEASGDMTPEQAEKIDKIKSKINELKNFAELEDDFENTDDSLDDLKEFVGVDDVADEEVDGTEIPENDELEKPCCSDTIVTDEDLPEKVVNDNVVTDEELPEKVVPDEVVTDEEVPCNSVDDASKEPEMIDCDCFDGSNIVEADLEAGDSELFPVDEPKEVELDFDIKVTPDNDPILDAEDEVEDFNVEETLAPKKKYKPKFKKVK